MEMIPVINGIHQYRLIKPFETFLDIVYKFYIQYYNTRLNYMFRFITPKIEYS